MERDLVSVAGDPRQQWPVRQPHEADAMTMGLLMLALVGLIYGLVVLFESL